MYVTVSEFQGRLHLLHVYLTVNEYKALHLLHKLLLQGLHLQRIQRQRIMIVIVMIMKSH